MVLPLFEPGFRSNGYTFHTVNMDALLVTSGQLIACDPLTDADDAVPFTRTVPPGQYPVILSIAVDAEGQRLVAGAMLQFSTRPVHTWELALTAHDLAEPDDDGAPPGFAVDAALGAFMDADALGRLHALEPPGDFYMRFFDTPLTLNGGDWALFQPDPHHPANLAAFSTGGSDGVFPCAFALDLAGHPVALVTHFGLIDPRGGWAQRLWRWLWGQGVRLLGWVRRVRAGQAIRRGTTPLNLGS
jgi:hypothetical protein